jgi:ubiquinone/menaquinone biosynthesis C-methylase UbiE
MLRRFRHRSYQLEHIDIGDYTPEEYEGAIIELQRVNKWLGDARALEHSLLADVKQAGLRSFSVIDAGAGSGELMRVAAAWSRQNKIRATLVGIELNARSAEAILENSVSFPEINSVHGDALQLPFADGAVDYAICSLFTHHFVDDDVVRVLNELSRVARRRIFVIDLFRHPIAYYLYTTLGRLILHNRLLREDGALSILRSFKPAELVRIAERAGLENISVTRRFPFRLVLSAKGKGLKAASTERHRFADQRIRLAS